MYNTEHSLSFSDLKLSPEILESITKAGYVNPSVIQQQVIPLLIDGRDIIGQAETGSGKTGAFALPLLSNLKNTKTKGGPEILVLAPTRELAMQVAESFKKYSVTLPWVKTACIYGGQGYKDQISALKASPQIVVGTPGRIIDHIEKGYLKLDRVTKLVLDEADEMLRMGFQEDVEFIVSNAPAGRQTALFSATMPPAIARIAQNYLTNPVEIKLKSKTLTSKNIKQKYWMVSESNKLQALTRLLEVGNYTGVIVFVRTKSQAVELTEKIHEAGFSASPLNGDIAQSVREKTVARFKAKKFDVLVATDVAARGLDIGRVDLIVNYDIPFDPESYVHRIGRTGRAGSTGEAVLFVTRRDLRALQTIERTIKLKIEKAEIPTVKEINASRFQKMKEEVVNQAANIPTDSKLRFLVEQIVQEEGLTAEDIATAVLMRAYSKAGAFLSEKTAEIPAESEEMYSDRPSRSRGSYRGGDSRNEGGRGGRGKSSRSFSRDKKPSSYSKSPSRAPSSTGGGRSSNSNRGNSSRV